MTTTQPFKGTVLVGWMDTGDPRKAKATVTVEWDGERLSLQGEARRAGTADCDMGGQIREEVAAIPAADLLIPAADRTKLVDYWKRWHLNDMRAGCEHQRAAGWGERPIDPDKPLDTYGLHYPGQRQESWNMLGWVRPSEHPDGLLTKECEVCGYRYGTAWLSEAVPDEVLTWLAKLVDAG